MEKFCKKCGSKLNENAGKCPRCDLENSNNKGKNNSNRKLLRIVIFLLIFIVVIGGVLIYKGTLKSLFISRNENEKNRTLSMEDFEKINFKCIEVQEGKISMQNSTEGKVAILIQMPNYEQMFKKAITANDPEKYVFDCLKNGEYKTKEFTKEARVSVKDGDTIVHSEEIVNQLLEQELINAINTLSEDGGEDSEKSN